MSPMVFLKRLTFEGVDRVRKVPTAGPMGAGTVPWLRYNRQASVWVLRSLSSDGIASGPVSTAIRLDPSHS